MQIKKFSRNSSLLFASLLLSMSCLAAESGIYRWLDEQGNPQYSDIPPTGVETTFMPSSGGKPRVQEKVAEQDKESAPSGPAAITGEMEVFPPKDAERCKQAQSNLQALGGRARVRITEADGSQRFLTEEEKEAQRELARKSIELNCN